MKRTLLALALILGGCASSPETITASYVSPILYRNLSCDQLAEEGHRLLAAYQVAAAKQNQAVTGDAVGVLLIGLPLSSMTGNNVAPEVAKIKGEHEAVVRAGREKGCTIAQ